MYRFTAKKIEHRLKSLDGVNGKIHSIFQKSMNILLETGALCSILSDTEDEGPYGIILNQTIRFDRLNLSVGDVIYISNGFIRGKSLEVSLENAINYSVFLEQLETKPDEKRVYQVNQFLQTILKEKGNSNGYIGLEFQKRLNALQDALIHHQDVEMKTRKLIGLGLGLTPSGDDSITGCMLSLWYCMGEDNESVVNMKSAIQTYCHQTTDVGKFMLEQATIGCCRKSLRNMICGLANNQVPLEEKLYQDVLAIGASSGLDMIRGVACAFYVMNRARKDKQI